MYVHGVPKQKESADVHVHIKIHVILYKKFNYCKPATIYMNHILIFHPSKFVCVFFFSRGKGLRYAFHSLLRADSYYAFFSRTPFRAL